MSAVESGARAPLQITERLLCGWGRTARSRCRVARPRSVEDVLEVLARSAGSPAGVIARGAGRSYGDAAQRNGGEVLDMTGMNGIISIDPGRAVVSVEAGATIGQVMGALAPHGLTLPVLPGTRHVTLAGAIASDIHGKNHHRDGAIARHVLSISLCTPAAGLLEVSPESDPDLFYATLGGMGLTGVMVRATLRAERLACPWVAADIDRTDSLQHTLELMSGEDGHRYSVAWLDLLAEGSKMGRAVVSRADPLPSDGSSLHGRGRRASSYPGALSRRATFDVPHRFPTALLRRSSMSTFNALRWRSTPRQERGRRLAMVPYFFPLDGLGEWNRLYGASGLIQYQFVVPAGQEHALERCFALISDRRLPVYLAVFKRFGPAFGGPLSFPLEGWTLAVDLPAAAEGVRAALDELDEILIACGGRVYLSKDVRLRAELMSVMYPRLEDFQTQRARVDPAGLLRSDLALRLGLCGARA
ncbi:MAG TPA: FAD-binding oxidoreductase [Solirubrobacteraceae bacterium]|jgi:decaprenylphospho-beta-D-ribofuranose 2-oxidase